MINVACSGCHATYQVDHRRVPPEGIKMRCPKCQTTFLVQAPDESSTTKSASSPTKDPSTSGMFSTNHGPFDKPLFGQPFEEFGLSKTSSIESETKSSTALADGVFARDSLLGDAPFADSLSNLGTPKANRETMTWDPDSDAQSDSDKQEAQQQSAILQPADAANAELYPDPWSIPFASDGSDLDFDLNAHLPIPKQGISQADKPPSLSNELAISAAETLLSIERFHTPIPERKAGSAQSEGDYPHVTGDDATATKTTGEVATGPNRNIELEDIALPARKEHSNELEDSVGLPATAPLTSGSLDQDPLLPTRQRSSKIADFGELDLPLVSDTVDPFASRDPFSSSDFGDSQARQGHGGAASPGSTYDLPARGPHVTQDFLPSPIAPEVAFGAALPDTLHGADASDLSHDPFDNRNLASDSPSVTRQAGGGVQYGELDLGSDDEHDAADAGEPWKEGETDAEGMEFGDIPQQGLATSDGAYTDNLTAPASARVSTKYPRKSKSITILLAVVSAVVIVGLAMAATPLGAFGSHLFSDTINANKYEQLLAQTTGDARAKLQRDTANEALDAISQTDKAIAQAPRSSAIAAFGAWLSYLYEVRFGADATMHAHANALVAAAMQQNQETPYLDLAKAAKSAAEGEIAKARQSVQTLARLQPKNIDVAVLEAEVELVAQELASAQAAWKRAATLETSARTTFGLARVNHALHKPVEAREFAQKTLEKSPNHVGARILLAELDIAENKRNAAAEHLETIIGPAQDRNVNQAASKKQQVVAWSMLGRLHLHRCFVSAAENAFSEALKLDPNDAIALCGLGEVLFQEARYAEALTRFETAMQSDARSVQARIGTAKACIALERLQDAKNILQPLSAQAATNPLVALWSAKVEEGLGNQQLATKILSDALAGQPKSVDAVGTYVALIQQLTAQGQTEQAAAKLQELKTNLAGSVELHRALGQLALESGQLQEAKSQLEKALQIDPEHLASLFDLGITLRRLGKFDGAANMFDKVANADKRYPGLALERGLLFEASGQPQQAIEMYQEALAKAPNDPDLMLRVGSAEVVAGQASQAESVLRNVLRLRPNSAEANHYLGRACLLKGSNLAEALRYLQRAAEIDPHRATYWLYIGWAANETGQPTIAQNALKKALELDQGLADAYWQRGVLLRKQGAVVDAQQDLTKALELNPARFEAYATLAECYEDQSQWKNATAAWNKAIEADANRALWRYKLGRLYYHAHQRNLAAEQLTQAINIAAKETRPPWLWEANLMLADISRLSAKRKEAIGYYREFLKFAPADNPFREDAIKQLTAYGASIEER